MKIIPIALQEHYDSGATSVAYGLVLKRKDSQEYGFTSFHDSFTLDVTPWGFSSTELYMDAEQGFSASSIVSTAGFEVDNMEITTLDDGSFFNRDDIQSGKWTNTEFWVFKYRYDVNPVTIENDIEVLQRGWFGEVTLNQNTIIIELRGLAQKLQQSIGIVTTKTCRARLGSTTGLNKCKVDLTPWTHELTVTSVTDKSIFASAYATQADDYFGGGTITFTSGNNSGVIAYVNSFVSGTFSLQLGVTLDIQVGDTFIAVAGCRKRLVEDCKGKFNNVINFQGEPHKPSPDVLSKLPIK